jgi:hypothetical protein
MRARPELSGLADLHCRPSGAVACLHALGSPRFGRVAPRSALQRRLKSPIRISIWVRRFTQTGARANSKCLFSCAWRRGANASLVD